MSRALLGALRRGKAQVLADLRTDPYLPYILLFAAVLGSFFIWHRLPNFATRDERWRILDPLQPVGRFVETPSLGSVREGITYWRSYGGTFYVYGLVLVPLVVFLLATGESGALVDLSYYSINDLRADWQQVPGWVWTAAILPARLVNVLFFVGSVYVVYRIGTEVRDRQTGRLAALLTALTWGLVVLAHEAGEDVPAVFFFLLAMYLALQYVASGSRRTFYLGCLCGGLAAGFKFNAGVSALVLGAAHLTYARRTEGAWRDAFFEWRFLLTGMAVGAAAIAFSYPQMLVAAPVEFGERVGRGVQAKGDPHSWLLKPSWWWISRGFLNGLGVPLSFASVAGVLGALIWSRESSREGDLARLSLLAVGVMLLVYSQWAYVRTHHLVLTFPLLILLVAVGAGRLREHRETIAVVLTAVLVLSTGAYTVVGDLGYAAQGRDQATAWLEANAEQGDTVEIYVRDPQETVVPHGIDMDKPPVPGAMPSVLGRCPEFIVLENHRSLLYLASANHSDRADRFDDRGAGEYVRDLLAEDTYPYEIAGTFGPRPRYLDGKPRRAAWWRLVRAGVQPRVPQYGDPQDLGVYQYTIVLERTGSCDETVDPSA